MSGYEITKKNILCIKEDFNDPENDIPVKITYTSSTKITGGCTLLFFSLNICGKIIKSMSVVVDAGFYQSKGEYPGLSMIISRNKGFIQFYERLEELKKNALENYKKNQNSNEKIPAYQSRLSKKEDQDIAIFASINILGQGDDDDLMIVPFYLTGAPDECKANEKMPVLSNVQMDSDMFVDLKREEKTLIKKNKIKFPFIKRFYGTEDFNKIPECRRYYPLTYGNFIESMKAYTVCEVTLNCNYISYKSADSKPARSKLKVMTAIVKPKTSIYDDILEYNEERLSVYTQEEVEKEKEIKEKLEITNEHETISDDQLEGLRI